MKKFRRIALEGGEGTGKSSLLEALKEELNPEENLFFNEPYRESSTVAAQFEAWRMGLLELDEIEEVKLFAESRAELNHDKIIPGLEKNCRIWQDRSIISSLVYQGERHGLSRNEILEINMNADPEFSLPDLVIILDGEPLYLKDRLLKNNRHLDKIDQEPLWFHQQIREGFLKLKNDLPCEFLVLDAFSSVEENKKIILDFIKEKGKN
jgi:dTMP kinase